MRKMFFLLVVIILAGLVWFSCSKENPTAPVTVSPSAGKMVNLQGNIERVAEILQQHNPNLMANADVVGTAVGLGPDGTPAILVLAKVPGARGIPVSLDGVTVMVEVTGEILALAQPGKPDAVIKIDPTGTFTRPVPIGVSTGNVGECSAGTIGCRVKDVSGNVYALSNNHVYALENDALVGSKVLQPGRYDTAGYVYNPDNVIGTLSAFEPIVFSTSASNKIDAAIALSDTGKLGNATPSNGYGTPKSSTVLAYVGMPVQKYGRTTALTKGKIYAINATVNVGYSSGTARLVNQIWVYSNKPFIKAGDSGSLLVTDPGKNPVGLLFAGDSSGQWAVANRIDLVLSAFGVSVDGE